MGQAISAILPTAVGAAISPVAIIAVILMLFTAKARVHAPVFALGWALGLLVVTAIAYLLGDSQRVSSDEDASNLAFVVKAALGVMLMLLAAKQRKAPRWARAVAMPGRLSWSSCCWELCQWSDRCSNTSSPAIRLRSDSTT
jgi:hypothetical protein